MKRVAGLLLLVGLPVAQALAAAPEPPGADITRACRDTFPEVAANPNADGGWRLFDQTGGRVLCVYGSLPEDMLPDLVAAVEAASELTVAVRSTGGPAASWLALAEHLAEAGIELVVDEACFSSCANYLPIVARSIRAVENSLLVWHGGPNANLDRDTERTMGNIFEIIAYDALSRRARGLYDARGVSIELLRVSALRTSDAVMTRLMAEAGLAHGAYSVAGYAFSPATLAECFGLDAAKDMWHAGGDVDLIRLAQRRSATLIVLESPRAADGARICRADPADPPRSADRPPDEATPD